jgi:uncharacterized protein YukJ
MILPNVHDTYITVTQSNYYEEVYILPCLSEYGVLKGKVIGYSDGDARQDPYSPHVQVYVGYNGHRYKVQINVKSSRNNPIKRHNSFVKRNYDYCPQEIAVDYILSKLFNPCKMEINKHNLSWSDNNLVDFLVNHIKTAQYKDATIYVYGEPYDNPLGIHDVHMN